MWYIIISSYELLIIKALTMKLIFLESSRLETEEKGIFFQYIYIYRMNIN